MLANLNLKLISSIAKKKGKSFRKQLPLDYKKGDKHDHRKTHSMPLLVKQKLLNEGKAGNWKKIRQIQRQSLTPFGKFTRTGFVFDKDKLPFYDIPNLEGFELKPYVQFNAAKLEQNLYNYQKTINKTKLEQIQNKSLPLPG